MISVLLCDDQHLVRSGFRMILETEPDIHVVGEASDGREVVAMARRVEPDVVLMDVQMPNMDGLEATARVTALDEPPKVLILTTFERDDYVFSSLRAGASGFLLKNAPPEQLVDAVRVIAAGDALLAPSITRRLIREFANRPVTSGRDEQRLAVLTEREREITSLVAEGLSNDEIAHRLTISPATARTHVSRAITKLGARDRAQLVVLAYQTGLAASNSPHGR